MNWNLIGIDKLELTPTLLITVKTLNRKYHLYIQNRHTLCFYTLLFTLVRGNIQRLEVTQNRSIKYDTINMLLIYKNSLLNIMFKDIGMYSFNQPIDNKFKKLLQT